MSSEQVFLAGLADSQEVLMGIGDWYCWLLWNVVNICVGVVYPDHHWFKWKILYFRFESASEQLFEMRRELPWEPHGSMFYSEEGSVRRETRPPEVEGGRLKNSQARVLVGRYCKGSASDVEPPVFNEKSGDRYDTTVDHAETDLLKKETTKTLMFGVSMQVVIIPVAPMPYLTSPPKKMWFYAFFPRSATSNQGNS